MQVGELFGCQREQELVTNCWGGGQSRGPGIFGCGFARKVAQSLGDQLLIEHNLLAFRSCSSWSP